ncbi:MAG: bifunctional adenosylcobinamide kinase/adenosylcobinamide-phosphate guanylyltransferase, partial [Nitrospirales bacterium]
GQPLDDEMADRISRHRRVRGTDWVTAEVPLDVEAWFRKEGSAYRVIVLDCVTLWLSNLLGSGLPGEAIPSRVADLLEVVRATGARAVVVSNELGFGLVPADPVSREFRDLAGRVNQQFAAMADEVYLVVAGLALRVK